MWVEATGRGGYRSGRRLVWVTFISCAGGGEAGGWGRGSVGGKRVRFPFFLSLLFCFLVFLCFFVFVFLGVSFGLSVCACCACRPVLRRCGTNQLQGVTHLLLHLADAAVTYQHAIPKLAAFRVVTPSPPPSAPKRVSKIYWLLFRVRRGFVLTRLGFAPPTSPNLRRYHPPPTGFAKCVGILVSDAPSLRADAA